VSKNIAYFILISGTMWSFTQVPLENTRCECDGIWRNIQPELSYQIDSNSTNSEALSNV